MLRRVCLGAKPDDEQVGLGVSELDEWVTRRRGSVADMAMALAGSYVRSLLVSREPLVGDVGGAVVSRRCAGERQSRS